MSPPGDYLAEGHTRILDSDSRTRSENSCDRFRKPSEAEGRNSAMRQKHSSAKRVTNSVVVVVVVAAHLAPLRVRVGCNDPVQRLMYDATVTIKWWKNRYRFASAVRYKRYRPILFRVSKTNQHTMYLIRFRNFISCLVQWIFSTRARRGRSKCVTQLEIYRSCPSIVQRKPLIAYRSWCA